VSIFFPAGRKNPSRFLGGVGHSAYFGSNGMTPVATRSVPSVFTPANSPVADSLAKGGGRVTGAS